MTSLSQDTPPEIERLMIEGYRRMTGAQKLCIMQDLNRAARLLALGDIQRQYPNASEREIRLRLASRWIEPELMKKAFGWDVEVEGYYLMSATDANTPQQKDQLPDILYVALLVTERLATLGIRYLIGGSMASIIHGLPRLTQNIDLVAEIKEPHIPALVQAFAEEFYVDEQAIQRAIRQHSSFN